MGELAILDGTGDTKVIWDTQNKDEIEAAEAQFDILIEKGFKAFEVKKSGEPGKKIKKFKPKAGKIIMVPTIIGG